MKYVHVAMGALMTLVASPLFASEIDTNLRLQIETEKRQGINQHQRGFFSNLASQKAVSTSSAQVNMLSNVNGTLSASPSAFSSTEFTEAEIAGGNFMLVGDNHPSYFPTGGSFSFFTDNSGIAGLESSFFYSEEAISWQVSAGKLQIISASRIEQEFDSYPYGTIAKFYGQEIADHLIAKHDAGELSWQVSFEEEVYFDILLEKLSVDVNKTRVKISGKDLQRLIVPSEWGWNASTIDSEDEIDIEETFYSASSSLFDTETTQTLAGEWFVGLYQAYSQQQVDPTIFSYGIFGERLILNDDGSVSNSYSGDTYTWSLQNSVLTLSSDIDSFVITPVIEVNKAFVANVEQYESGHLVRVFNSQLAKFDNSFNQFTDAIVTTLPNIWLSNINLTSIDKWDGDIPIFDSVWGYKFFDDGSFYRGITADYDENSDPTFSFGQKWNYSINYNHVVTSYKQGTFSSRERHWEVLSVDADGKALVFEYSYWGWDNNQDGTISADEIKNHISPRLNSMLLLDLRQYPEVWDSLPDQDNDGVNDYLEAEYGTTPTNPDSDNDGINDGDEIALGLNPLSEDTDGDGFTDGFEQGQGSDPQSSSSTPGSSTLRFSLSDLNNPTAVLLADAKDGHMQHAGTTIHFNDDRSGIYSSEWLHNYTSKSMTWSLSNNGQLLINSQNQSTNYLSSSNPYTEIANSFGQDVADWLVIKSANGLFPDDFNFELQESVGDLVLTKHSIANGQLNIIESSETTTTLMIPDGYGWVGELPQNKVTSESVVQWKNTFENQFVGISESDLQGKWGLFLESELTYGALRGFGSVDGLYADMFTFHDDKSVGSAFAEDDYTWALVDDALEFSSADHKIIIKPFKTLGKVHLALYEVYENGTLTSIYATKLAKFDDSYVQLTNNIATQLPTIYFAGINAHIPQQWDGEQLLLENVFGYQFRENGTMRRGVAGFFDELIQEDTFYMGQEWTYTVADNIIEMSHITDERERVRTWDIISVDDNGRALVFERSRYDIDFNGDGVISGDEIGGAFIAPRFNTLELFNLSQYEDIWESLPDDDMDGLNNYQEADYGTDLYNNDSDFDGILDGDEVLAGLNPLDPTDASADFDNDGLTNAEEIALGTDVNNADTDMDGVSDFDERNAGTNPLDANDYPTPVLTTMSIADITNDGASDVLGYYMQAGVINVEVFSSNDYVSLNTFSITHSFDNPQLHLLEDNNGNGSNELGVFGFNSEVSRYQLFVYDIESGNQLSVFNWPATLLSADFVALADLSGDGVQEYAISGVHSGNGTRQLVVKNGATRGAYATFKWPNQWLNPTFVTMTDITADGVPEVALYGQHERLDKGQLFVYDGASASTKIDVYNWNKLWTNIQLLKMDDVDGEGTLDWGQFGQRKDDGRYQLVVKKGHDKRGVIRTFSWPNDLVDVKPLLIADRTGDGVREVAVTGTSPVTGKQFLRINDGKLANQRIANYSWPSNWENSQIVELGDLDNDGFNEFALLGYLKTNGNVQLIVKNGQTATELGRYTLTGDWRDVSVTSYIEQGEVFIALTGIDQVALTNKVTVLNTELNLVGTYAVQ
ncbi:thrombospondin type 3 repeat-containing protein [Shewanella sp. 6_MG-2023]|uniref:thrombospondin type 3 repeat-containing protein n=1 Tax=Shewanella sp. 6_MG-2023 TaxID=3062660 RepID=UPI0026E47B3C|nr:hypothetical protein [Shewanella sp. 6_MG-2023]MDO6617634.1 hypothetical protein [Shewanella sp. 6_MG-2023]